MNIHEKLCVKLVIYKDHTRIHGQQNIKKKLLFFGKAEAKWRRNFEKLRAV